ncbi:MAG: conserved phage C-terminal domain-containing protein [Candidatus Hodarchaeales archaeon]
MKESFIFYRSFYESLQNVSGEDRLEVYDAVCEYSLNGSISTCLDGISMALFLLMKPQIDANLRRYENGKKGGRPKTEEEPRLNLDLTKTKPNANVNANANANVNENKKENDKRKKAERKTQALEVLRFLNEKTDRNYREVDSNLDLITTRLKSGVTVKNCKSIIAKKCREWMDDPEMMNYLRPATLFGKLKFEQYYGELFLKKGENENENENEMS